LKENRNDLISSAVPSFVFDNQDDWNYLVDHGYVEDYETGFVFKTNTLTAKRKACLLRTLLPTYATSILATSLIFDLIRVVENDL